MNTAVSEASHSDYRRDLTNGITILERLGIIDFNGHFSVRLDGGYSLGEPYIFSPEEAAACQKGLWKQGLFEKCWNYYLAKFGLAD